MTTLVATGREGARRLALARIGVGLAGLLAPTLFGRAWIGSEGSSRRVGMITRAFAVRDLALGLGAFIAIQRRAPVRGWVEAGLLCDAADTVSTVKGGVGRLQKVPLVGAALVAVFGGILSLKGLDEPQAVR
jgi:hypothetical protein